MGGYKKKRRISNDVVLVAVGVAVVLTLQQCDSDDGCRYVYRTISDCESDWGYGVCRERGGKYYGPEREQCNTSHTGGGSGGGYGGGSDGKGTHAIGIERGGFGGSGHRFGGGS